MMKAKKQINPKEKADFETKDEVKESEDNWNNEGGAINTPDEGFEKKESSAKPRKPYNNKVRVSKISRKKIENKPGKKRA